MRYLFLAIPILLLGALAGCVWPPDSTPNPIYNPPYISYNIHRISQRSLAGVERVATVISPYDNETGTYVDSVRYVVVNGDTVYRHPFIVSPTTIDSSAPYLFDGSSNIVAMVFPSITIFDTSYVPGVTQQITSPPYGDTINRASDALFVVQPNTGYDAYYEGEFQITDSLNFYSQTIDSYNESVDFPSNELETLQGGTLWAMLLLTGSAESNNSYYPYEVYRSVELDRIVAYHLK